MCLPLPSSVLLCRPPFADHATFGNPFDRTRRRWVGRSRPERTRRRRGRKERPPPPERKRLTRPKPPRTRSPKQKARARLTDPLRSQSSRATRRRVARSKCYLQTLFRDRRCFGTPGIYVWTVFVFRRVRFGLGFALWQLSFPLYVPPSRLYFELSLAPPHSNMLLSTCILYLHAKNKYF